MKFLIVDDDRESQLYFIVWFDLWLKQKVFVISAYTIEEARRLFVANPDIMVIAMDACVPGAVPNTMPLVKEFRRTFFGPMVAIASRPCDRDLLMDSGCDCQCDKVLLPETIVNVLSL